MSHIHDYDDILSAKPMKSRRVFVGGGDAFEGAKGLTISPFVLPSLPSTSSSDTEATN